MRDLSLAVLATLIDDLKGDAETVVEDGALKQLGLGFKVVESPQLPDDTMVLESSKQMVVVNTTTGEGYVMDKPDLNIIPPLKFEVEAIDYNSWFYNGWKF